MSWMQTSPVLDLRVKNHPPTVGAMTSRVWQLPVRTTLRYRVMVDGEVVVKVRRGVRWYTAG